jgi:hypothetical protein
MKSKVPLGEAAYVLVGVGVSGLVVLAIAYLVYSFWKQFGSDTTKPES